VTVRAVLRPSTGEPGALTLVAQVERRPFAALLNIDNRASRFTGPVEMLALLDLNSFTEFGERTEVNFYHTDGNTQNFGQITTEAFLGGSGLRRRVYAGYGEASPSGFLRDVLYHGTTTVFGGSLTYPLIRARQQTLNLSGYFDGIETQVTQVGASASGIQRGFDSLRVARLAADYAQQVWLAGRCAAGDQHRQRSFIARDFQPGGDAERGFGCDAGGRTGGFHQGGDGCVAGAELVPVGEREQRGAEGAADRPV